MQYTAVSIGIGLKYKINFRTIKKDKKMRNFVIQIMLPRGVFRPASILSLYLDATVVN